MSHTITITISAADEPKAEFTCMEPAEAWCRQNAVGSGEHPPSNPSDCWFTVLASGFSPWGKGGMYDGPPTELRSGEVEFTPVYIGHDYCFWHYKGDGGGYQLGGAGRPK